MSIIYIRFHEELPTNNQNNLRFRMEMAKWKKDWREAEEQNDYQAMDWLDKQFEMVGLP